MAEELKRSIPLLPLRGLLVYPTMVLHLDVGRDKSVQALEQAMMHDHMIFLATQQDISIDEPGEDEIFTVGTYTKIKQMLKLPNGTIRVLVEASSAPISSNTMNTRITRRSTFNLFMKMIQKIQKTKH